MFKQRQFSSRVRRCTGRIAPLVTPPPPAIALVIWLTPLRHASLLLLRCLGGGDPPFPRAELLLLRGVDPHQWLEAIAAEWDRPLEAVAAGGVNPPEDQDAAAAAGG